MAYRASYISSTAYVNFNLPLLLLLFDATTITINNRSVIFINLNNIFFIIIAVWEMIYYYVPRKFT